MDYRYKQLEQDLSALHNEFSDLGSRLSEAAKDVTTSGVPPSDKLIEQILMARTRFESVRSAVHSQAASMLVSPLPTAGELGSLQTIGDLLKIAASAEESKNSAEGERERTTNILSRVLAIRHRETADFQPLQECHAKVTELRNAISKVAWPNRHPEAEAVLGLRHPCTVLLNFVENLDTLEDDKWMALEATITEAYGKPLFVAASRGKLVAQQQQATAVPSPEPAKPAAAVEKPVERKPALEKSLDKTGVYPTPVAPVEKAVERPVERQVERPVERKEAPVAPVHVAPAPVAVPPPVAPAAAVAQAPAVPAQAVAPPAPAPLTPITSATLPPRPPAPVSTPPAAVAPAPPAPAVASSLSALATATEPVTDRKPAVTPPSESPEKSRKEPRLAVPAPPQQPARTEATPQEQEHMGDEASRALAGDGSQRPQRWGFWRGNR